MDQKPERYFEVKKWNAVALWSIYCYKDLGWNIHVDNCAICKNHIMEKCIECDAAEESSGKDCTVAWGVCNHVQ